MSNLRTIFGGVVAFAVITAALPALAQRNSSVPAYRPPPPPPPVYRPPPPAVNQNVRSGTHAAPANNNAYGAPRPGGLSSQGSYRPGSIANPGGRAGGTSSAGGWGNKAHTGPSATTPALANRPGGLGKAAQPGAHAFSRSPAAANDNVAKQSALPKAALATGAGAGLFAKAQAGAPADKSPSGTGGRRVGGPDERSKSDRKPCSEAPRQMHCQFECTSKGLVMGPRGVCIKPQDKGGDGGGAAGGQAKADDGSRALEPAGPVRKPTGF